MGRIEPTILRPLHKSRVKLSLSAVLLALIAYYYGSKAIDTGSYFDYFLALVALFFSIKAVIWAIKFNGKQ